MRDVLTLLLLLSLSGSILGLLVLALRRLIRSRTQPRFWYYLWIVVVLRFLLPLGSPVVAIPVPVTKAVLWGPCALRGGGAPC